MTFLDHIPQLFFAIPLVIAFSFVYQGTRSEKTSIIIRRSIRTMISLTILMIVILAFLKWMSP
ncbi:MAG: hypothetical protein LBT05_13710 [Planctomycetaceae bacterium]|jgi:hypothetical protein|nr:hypothetical protein [Planctomycetaceae bacterium]